MHKKALFSVVAVFVASLTHLSGTNAAPNSNAGGVAKNWSPTQIAQAIPRDLVVDERGLAYMKGKSGEFIPYGHSVQFAAGSTKNPDTTKGRFKAPAPSPSPTPTQLPTIANSEWTSGNYVQQATGRLYFYMPTSSSKLSEISTWSGFVCSGTVVTDTRTDQSLILTAAHCIYDDVNKVFAARVMFIPNQSASGTPTDRYCANDIMGCWIAEYGVVDTDWTIRTFPANAQWDYGYYVVNNTGSHYGNGGGSDLVLDGTVQQPLSVNFSNSIPLAYSYAFGYSYNQDPKFMYCAQSLGTTTAIISTGQWWLSQCGLTGGSSGGPWMQTAGSGPIFSVNSWGYSGSSGMAGPRLGTALQCLYIASEDTSQKPKSGGLIPSNC